MTRAPSLLASIAGLLLLSVTAFAAGIGVPRATHAEDAVVGIQDQQFQPDVIVINPGDTVTWTNLDDTGHAVAFNDGQFQSGLLLPGSSAKYEFLSQGVFLYRCDIHSTMTGTVYVGTTPPDGDGGGPSPELVPPTSTPSSTLPAGLSQPSPTPTPPGPPEAAATSTPGFVPPTPTPADSRTASPATATVAVLGTAGATSTAAKAQPATPTLTVAAPAAGTGNDGGDGGHTGLYMGLGIGASLFAVVMLAGLGLAMRRERKGALPDEEVV